MSGSEGSFEDGLVGCPKGRPETLRVVWWWGGRPSHSFGSWWVDRGSAPPPRASRTSGRTLGQNFLCRFRSEWSFPFTVPSWVKGRLPPTRPYNLGEGGCDPGDISPHKRRTPTHPCSSCKKCVLESPLFCQWSCMSTHNG